jgi:dolichol kinase
MYRRLRTGPAWSRNFSHFVAGLISLPYPWLFTSHWWVLLLAVQSSLVLLSTRFLGLLPSHHKVAEKSLGSYLFFASIYLCYMASYLSGQKELFVIPLLVLSFSDVLAAVVGRSPGSFPLQQMKWPGPSGKTVAGSTAFFISALVILFVSLHYLGSTPARSMLMAVAISIPATASEALSPYGIDNFSVPLTILLFMQLGLFF